MRWTIVAAGLLALAGCSAAQQAANECTDAGYVKGTQPFLWCQTVREQSIEAQRGAALMLMGGGMMNYGRAVSTPMPVYQPPSYVHCFAMGPNLNCSQY